MERLQQQLADLRTENTKLKQGARKNIKVLNHPPLSALGYCYLPGPSGVPSDWVLRQTEGTGEQGFEWKGQQNYDAVGEAVTATVTAGLTSLCGLCALNLLKGAGLCYASPNVRDRTDPLLLLVCGSSPGGAAGVWGRSLCVNTTLHEVNHFTLLCIQHNPLCMYREPCTTTYFVQNS